MAPQDGAIVGIRMMLKYGWTIGQRVTLQSQLMRKDGTGDWSFEIVAAGNLFIVDYNAGAVVDFPLSGGSYAPSSVTVVSDFNAPRALTIDRSGPLYLMDKDTIWRLTP